MTIRRITVRFVDAEGHAHGSASGPLDRRTEIIREARAELESFKSAARRAGDPQGEAPFTMQIEELGNSGARGRGLPG